MIKCNKNNHDNNVAEFYVNFDKKQNCKYKWSIKY